MVSRRVVKAVGRCERAGIRPGRAPWSLNAGTWVKVRWNPHLGLLCGRPRGTARAATGDPRRRTPERRPSVASGLNRLTVLTADAAGWPVCNGRAAAGSRPRGGTDSISRSGTCGELVLSATVTVPKASRRRRRGRVSR